MSEAEKPSPKKPYELPELKVYGTVRDLTKTVGFFGSPDGGAFPSPNRTSAA
jgi:hypothetical protein